MLADVRGEEIFMKPKYLLLNAIVGGLTLLFVANPANAGEGFSIGVSAARATVDVKDVGVDVHGDANGWRVFGLYMINKNLGIEAGYSSLGRPDDNTLPSNLEVETDSYDLYAVGVYPMSQNFGLIGKIGFASWKTETEVDDDDTTETHHDSTDLALSFGGQYDMSERFAIRGEYKWFDSQDSGAVRMASLSGLFRFK